MNETTDATSAGERVEEKLERAIQLFSALPSSSTVLLYVSGAALAVSIVGAVFAFVVLRRV